MAIQIATPAIEPRPVKLDTTRESLWMSQICPTTWASFWTRVLRNISVTADDENYLAWFRSSVREAQDDPRPTTSHAKVMEAAQTLIDEKRCSRPQ
jgi:hypothetical protein